MILTAHQKDDCLETVLLKLLRGAHITNLSGMEPMSGLRNDPFAKPMLGVSKTEVLNFLSSQGLLWRDDASNLSNKYMRNRVRNELIPLMSDMVGGSDVLNKRIDNLDEQSKKVKQHLSSKANAYLGTINKQFFMLSQNDTVLDLVQEEALHLWAECRMQGQHTLSYEHLIRLCRQITDFPERKQWTLNIGRGWNVKRNGNALEILSHISNRGGEEGSPRLVETDSAQSQVNARYFLSWSDVIDGDVEREGFGGQSSMKSTQNELARIFLQVPSTFLQHNDQKPANFTLKAVAGSEGMLFTPPWRRGHGPVKIKEFLRGQKVPLHLRDLTPIICFGNESERRVVAVFIEAGMSEKGDSNIQGRWVVHADFEALDEAEHGVKFCLEVLSVE